MNARARINEMMTRVLGAPSRFTGKGGTGDWGHHLGRIAGKVFVFIVGADLVEVSHAGERDWYL